MDSKSKIQREKEETLLPFNHEYEPIEIDGNEEGAFRVVAVLKAVL
jgi:hypothetical protein